MRTVLFATLMSFAGIASANAGEVFNCNAPASEVSKLSENARIQLMQYCKSQESTVSNVVKAVTPDKETVSAWGQASKDFAQAIGIAAKELGIAVNDFLDSPAGWILAIILILNFGGGSILGSVFWLITLCIWLFTFYKFYQKYASTVKYENKPVFWGLWNRSKVVSVERNEDYSGGFLLLGCIATLLFALFSGMALL